jgi:hypothetical protein
MHEIHQLRDIGFGCLRDDAVTDIEDMAGAPVHALENALRL